RNYAMEYIRNGLPELAAVAGTQETLELGRLAARLIGLQYFQETAGLIGVADGGFQQAAEYLASMMEGMGDEVSLSVTSTSATVVQSGLRIVRGLPAEEQTLILDVWQALWAGALDASSQLKEVEVNRSGEQLIWHLCNR
ncbi:MAG: hypothetical protein KDI36_08500, partial [Pseudomonadales bacterium]|nr:hypothetical protein [Pseudomonadales bacterium]